MMGSLVPEPQDIIADLRGSTLHVPNLRNVFRNWPLKTNVHYERIIPVVEGVFDRLVKSSLLREKYRKANYARFVSLYYPHSDWTRIKTLAIYIIWLFCWDDAIDQQGTGNLSNDLERAKTHRDNTKRVLEQVLGLGSWNHISLVAAESDHVNAELKAIGEELQATYSLEQRHTFMSQMQRYIENCDKEQSLRLNGELPNLKFYREMRHGTAAVWTLCALLEYGMGENIPEHIRYMGELQTIWAETSRGVWIANDILSLKKEIPEESIKKGESIVNAIPILMKEYQRTPQEAVNILLEDLAISVASFDTAAAILEEAAGEKGRQAIQRYCDACRCMVTGSIQFTFESTRYKLEGSVNEDGSLDIVL